MDKIKLYKLGKEAHLGNKDAMMQIIQEKDVLIKKYSYGNEDRYQYIVLNLIKAIKNYNFFYSNNEK
mgnify:CR=1 FL=1